MFHFSKRFLQFSLFLELIWSRVVSLLSGKRPVGIFPGNDHYQFLRFFRESMYFSPCLVTFSMYAVGYADIAENQNWVVACDPSYTSLSLEEISRTGRLTHLNVDFPQHDNCINSCAFNTTSTKISYSLGSESVRLWDVTSNSELANIHVSNPVYHLKHYMEEDSWLGIMNKSITLVDARDKQLSLINLPFSPSCFSISPNKQ